MTDPTPAPAVGQAPPVALKACPVIQADRDAAAALIGALPLGAQMAVGYQRRTLEEAFASHRQRTDPDAARVREAALLEVVEAVRVARNTPVSGPEHGAWDRGRRDGLAEADRIISVLLATPSAPLASDAGEGIERSSDAGTVLAAQHATPRANPTAADEGRVRAIETLARVTERMAPAGKYVARDILAGNLSPENERAIVAMIEFATSPRAGELREALEEARRGFVIVAEETDNDALSRWAEAQGDKINTALRPDNAPRFGVGEGSRG